MLPLFYTTAAIALIATVLAVTRRDGIHGLLYLVVSLLAVALVLFLLGAPFAAALEVIVYAGAIMVLFLFALMLLGRPAELAEGPAGARSRSWTGPALLAALLLGELVYLLALGAPLSTGSSAVPAKAVGASLFGPYLLAVELASVLLLAGVVGAWQLGHREAGR